MVLEEFLFALPISQPGDQWPETDEASAEINGVNKCWKTEDKNMATAC